MKSSSIAFILLTLSVGVFAVVVGLTVIKEEETTTTTPVCGNGVVEGTEQCDDGNKVSGDGCSTSCSTEAEETAEDTEVADTALTCNQICKSGDIVKGTCPSGHVCTEIQGLYRCRKNTCRGDSDCDCRMWACTGPDTCTQLVGTYFGENECQNENPGKVCYGRLSGCIGGAAEDCPANVDQADDSTGTTTTSGTSTLPSTAIVNDDADKIIIAAGAVLLGIFLVKFDVWGSTKRTYKNLVKSIGSFGKKIEDNKALAPVLSPVSTKAKNEMIERQNKSFEDKINK